jgi:hypothetical protein
MSLGDRLRARFRRPGEAVPAGGRGGRGGLERLGTDGCPACNLAEESAARWVGYFIAEGNAEEEVVRGLRASLGPCARHTRRLVAASGGAEVFARTAVMIAREALRRAGADEIRPPCPACAREAWAEGHATSAALRALGGPGADASPGGLERRFCLPHLFGALSAGPDPVLAVGLAEAGREGLRADQGEDLVVRVCGCDLDATARADLLRTAALPDRGPGLREWVLGLLALDACPSCLAEREAVRGAMEWLATSADHEPFELRLCPGHLGTLHALDALTARRVAAALAEEWSGALVRYAAELAGPFGRGPLGPLRARRAARNALQKLLGNRACRACDVARTAGARAGALLEAALRDPELAAAYGRSHGLCWRHLSQLPAAAREGLAGQILRARLAMLGWELEEAERKRSWFTRWEPTGSEASAWRRLPGLLGGAEAGIPPSTPHHAGG